MGSDTPALSANLQELSSGCFADERPKSDKRSARQFMLDIAQSATTVVISSTIVTHWWIFRTESGETLAYFGSPETLAVWKLRGVN